MQKGAAADESETKLQLYQSRPAMVLPPSALVRTGLHCHLRIHHQTTLGKLSGLLFSYHRWWRFWCMWALPGYCNFLPQPKTKGLGWMDGWMTNYKCKYFCQKVSGQACLNQRSLRLTTHIDISAQQTVEDQSGTRNHSYLHDTPFTQPNTPAARSLTGREK